MTLIERFNAYAADFERTFLDDDWSRLEQYFTDDAVYSTPTNGLRAAGRATVLATLRAAVSGFDRRCDSRKLVTTDGPWEASDQVRREWAASFTLRGAPELKIGGSERAVFRGDRIELLEVTITEDTLSRLMNYAAAYLAPRERWNVRPSPSVRGPRPTGACSGRRDRAAAEPSER